jgi:hypothetical protein
MAKLKPDYSVHVLKMFWQFVLLPVTVGRWACSLLAGWCSTPDSRRASDSLRQSRVRRGLRGLTPDHDPTRDNPIAGGPGASHAPKPASKTSPIR